MSKLFKSVLMSIVVLALVSACAAPAATPTQAPAAPAAAATQAPAAAASGAFKVGLLSSGSVNDQGWNSIAYNAMKQIQTQLGGQFSYVELQQDPASYEKAFRDYASQGYQFILGHGNEFQDSAIAVSKDYPNTQFFISSSYVHQGNVTGLNTASDQTFYLMGVMSAKMCKAAGFVGGMQIPPISEALTGFINGTRSINPNFKVYQTLTGSFTDAAAAKEAALSMIAQGADCILQDADVSGQGVYQAVVEKGPNIWTFGAFTPATDSAPGQVLANYTSDYGAGLISIAKAVKDGTFKPGKNVDFGLDRPDVMHFTYDTTSKRPIPQDVKDAVDAATKAIIAGTVNTLAPVK
ncbi:MAG: BMP family protein [Anaerolineaceae bacterium]|nr:BMP family protein [Anaerolineaceae bacterium]